MATFTLTAKYQSTRTGGFHIDKGDQFVIHINMAGITVSGMDAIPKLMYMPMVMEMLRAFLSIGK